jgi:hypothetical protein
MIALRSPISHRITPNFELIEAVVETGGDLVDLWERSPVRLASNKPNTDEVIDILFPENPLLCCGWRRHYFDTRPRNGWHKLHALQLIVPNPMIAKQGVTRDGKPSAHTLGNTGPRRFLIVEFDFDESNSPEQARLLGKLKAQKRDVRDLCAALLLHLAERAPLTMAVYSGGKSLHGWFYCTDVPEQNVLGFFRYALLLGADSPNWCRSQFARMPDGLRENGKRQSVYFLNPAVVK